MRQIKKLQICILLCFGFLFFHTPILGASNIQIYFNGQPLSFDTPPVIENDRVLVPMRTIFEALGFSVDWNHSEKTIAAENGAVSLEMQVDNKTAYLNQTAVALDTPPRLQDDFTLVPLRFIAEASGAAVTYHAEGPRIEIVTDKNALSDSIVMITANTGKQGSGVVLSQNGLIVTNYHVIDKASSLYIVFPDKSIYTGPVTIAGFHLPKDIVLLKVEKSDLPYAKMGDSDTVSPDDSVTAIGSPNGDFNKITTGRVLSTANQIIASTAPVQKGSSGGGLFNQKGELIGITYSFDSANHYFSIPINLVKKVATNQALSLSELPTSDSYPLEKLENIYVNQGRSISRLNWDYIYGAEYYHVYQSDTIDGPYERVINPINQTEKWYWGYPYSFSITSKGTHTFYFKISAVNRVQESPLSDPVKVTLKP